MPLLATKEQLDVIQAPIDQHMKVVAVAGSGKSHTLCLRVQHLISSGVSASRILGLVFNKKAQLDFLSRLKSESNLEHIPKIRTYHSLGKRLCDSFEKRGILVKRQLHNSSRKQMMLAKQSLKETVQNETKLNPCNPNKPKVMDAFLSFIELVKSDICSAEDKFTQSSINLEYRPFIEAFIKYEDLRTSEGIRFFSDLIYDPVQLLLTSKDAVDIVANHLDQIIVDEYQDVNPICQYLIKVLTGNRAHVTVVGDDDQTIYEFRGSNPNYLIHWFDNDFPGTQTKTLSTTFRYGHAISLAANNVISHNQQRVTKLCISGDQTSHSTISIYTEKEELNPISSIVNNFITDDNYQDVAILVRLFSMSPVVELSLLENGIPYNLEGHASVLSSDTVKALVALLEFSCRDLSNRSNESPVLKAIRIIKLVCPTATKSLATKIANIIVDNPITIVLNIEQIKSDIPKYLSSIILNLCKSLQDIYDETDISPGKVLDIFIEKTDFTTLIKKYSFKAEDADETLATIYAFKYFCIRRDQTTKQILSYLSDISKEQESNKSSNGVTITSIHRSKGLQWPYVVLPGLSEGMFPYSHSDIETDIQAERRLFYVGMTRAMYSLALIVPDDKLLIKSLKSNLDTPPPNIIGDEKCASRFVYEANLLTSLDLAMSLSDDSYILKTNKVPNPNLFNQYLTIIGSQYRLDKC